MILGLPDIFTVDRLTEKVVELCNDAGVIVEVRDIEACHRLSKKVTIVTQKNYCLSIDHLPKISYIKKILVQH